MNIEVHFVSEKLIEASVDEIHTGTMNKEAAALFADSLLAAAEEITEKLGYTNTAMAITLAREIFVD